MSAFDIHNANEIFNLYVSVPELEDEDVFGDDHNDLVMFDPQWMSIALGNECDALKAKADFITD